MKKSTIEILNNPISTIPAYYSYGWLGGDTLKKSFINWMIYKRKFSKEAQMNIDGLSEQESYTFVVEELFLRGELGFKVLLKCGRSWLGFKISGAPVFEAEPEIVIEDIKSLERGKEASKDGITQIFEEYEKAEGIKRRVWAFDAGKTFLGNPKWLYIYVRKYRTDIAAYWLSGDEKTAESMREQGLLSFCYGTKEAELIKELAGVYVTENVKEVLPNGMRNILILNLFHGVGCKRIERNQHNDFFRQRIARKYIEYNELYLNQQLLLVTSPFIEKDFRFQCGVREENVIRAGYPRCLYQSLYEPVHTHSRDPLREKGFDNNTKLAVYAPTYRYSGINNYFFRAFPSLTKLDETLRKNNILLIMKVHPNMESDPQYIMSVENKEAYSNILFWDNRDDFYEIINQIDLAIVDYSSFFTDLIAAGVKHFIRYIFDYDNEIENLDLMYNYFDVTTGKICRSFEELINALGNYKQDYNETEIQRIYNLYWEYASDDTFETIINSTLNHHINSQSLPILYSYDIFDTIIGRKVIEPKGIFYGVQSHMRECKKEKFGEYLIAQYPSIRMQCERNVRFRKKCHLKPGDHELEITFQDIFDNMSELFSLTKNQIDLLQKWEIEEEFENIDPLVDRVEEIKRLVKKGETVVLISDMYLPESILREMLCKVDSVFSNIPIFVSCEYGVRKVDFSLYLEVFNSFTFYKYKEWVHCGDNIESDGVQPQKLGIHTNIISKKGFDEYEKCLVHELESYPGYRIGGAFARYRIQENNVKNVFAHNYISLYFIPYISWVIKDAIAKGFDCLFFMSRDGHHLKRIADEIIRIRKYNLQTKYLYGSRKTWRVPSYIETIDDEFFSSYGAFAELADVTSILEAAKLNEALFIDMFPDMAYYINKKNISALERTAIVEAFRNSNRYREHLLAVAKEERQLVTKYIVQEIDPNKRNAVVEFWARGYTQDCFTRLLQFAFKENIEMPFYYVRSIDSTVENRIRYNYSSNTRSLLFLEALFANLPYKSIKEYQIENNKIVPIKSPQKCDMELYDAMEKQLVEATKEYCLLEIDKSDPIERSLYEFSLDYYDKNHLKDPIFKYCIAHLGYTGALNGLEQPFARSIDTYDLEEVKGKRNGIVNTKDQLLSYAISSPTIQSSICDIYQGEENLYQKKFKLNAKQAVRAKEFLKKKKSFEDNALKMQRLYDKSKQAIKEVKPHRVLIVTSNIEREEFISLLHEFGESKKIDLEYIIINKAYCNELEMKMIAEAKVIIVSANMELLNSITLRPETVLIQIMNNAFPYLKYGMSKTYKIINEEELVKEKYTNQYSYIPVASINTAKMISDIYGMKRGNWAKAFGSCITDIYFANEYLSRAKNKKNALLHDKEASEKKILLYMPMFRYRNASCQFPEVLDIMRLKHLIGQEYTILVSLDKKIKDKLVDMPIDNEIVFDFSDKMSIREQMCIADIIVGDYLPVFFEAALLRKPIYCTSYDCRKVEHDSQTNTTYAEVQLGPVVRNSDDLAQKLQNTDRYDYSLQEKFREKYLENCKGTSGQALTRFIEETIFDNTLLY